MYVACVAAGRNFRWVHLVVGDPEALFSERGLWTLELWVQQRTTRKSSVVSERSGELQYIYIHACMLEQCIFFKQKRVHHAGHKLVIP